MLSSSAWALREKYLCQRRKIQQKKKKEKKQCLSAVPLATAPLCRRHSQALFISRLSLSLCACILCNCKNHLKRHHTISKL